MAKAHAGGNETENMSNISILTAIEDDCFMQFSRSELVLIELPALKAQKWESQAAEWEQVA
jgi:AMMECR1 domain-containing protein